MPYINKPVRAILQQSLGQLSDNIATDGELNYAITILCKRYLGDDPHYRNYNAVVGVLECAKHEFYRRAVVPYEEEKIAENGDIFQER